MKTKTAPSTIKALRNECYDLLAATYNRNSKFYAQDCTDLWTHLLKKTESELRETASRQRAIASVTEREMSQHCQF